MKDGARKRRAGLTGLLALSLCAANSSGLWAAPPDQAARLPVHVASHGERLLPGHVYIAPDGFQMLAEQGGRVALLRSSPENGQCPSVSALFRSVSAVYGGKAVGILLTGMGNDGARELKLMRDRGAVTIAQDRESSVIFGMPGEAVNLDAAVYIMTPDSIVWYLSSSIRKEGQ